MSTAGPGNVLARWREARSWWAGEPYLEFCTYLDGQGIRRVSERAGPTLGIADAGGQQPLNENHQEEWFIRQRKTRNEKFRSASGVGSGPKPLALPVAHTVAQNSYVPLHVLSGYAFGRSLLLATDTPAMVAMRGCPAAGLADPHSLMGAFEHHLNCKKAGVKPLIGISVELVEGGEMVLIARNAQGYRNLSRLASACHLGEERHFPLGTWERLECYAEGLICLTGGDIGPLDRLLVRRDYAAAKSLAERLVGLYGRESVFLEVERSYLPWQMTVERQLLQLAEELRIRAVAGGVVTHARRSDFPAQDVLCSAETLCLIDEVIGRKPQRGETQPHVPFLPMRSLNAERFLRSSREMSELYADQPELLTNTLRVADLCDDDVMPKRGDLPSLFEDDSHALTEIVRAEAYTAYGNPTKQHWRRIEYELERIVRLGFATHFLVAWDFCRYAREQSIQMSGRGSVVDSAVAYVLGLSRIDAFAHRLHFDRFLPNDGLKRPDIDIDFEAKHRDDVRGYMVRKYGIERVGAVCAIGAYCTRGIVRAVGKVFGLPEETIGYLAKRIHGGVAPDQLEAALISRPELRDSGIPKERFRLVFELAHKLMDVPINVRTHSSGVVISKEPLRDIVPVQWSATPVSGESASTEPHLRMIQWDKRSAKHVFDKFDILCLRGQDMLSGTERRVRSSVPDFSVDRLAITEDPEVYRAMRSGELIGIPQSASPAMRQAHMRLRTNNLHDASLVQAGIRPGVGGAVKINELIARRRGAAYSFAHPELERILGLTYGIIIFQEQVDQLLQTFCGYTSGEAEDIRDAIHKRRREDYGHTIREHLIERALVRGFSSTVAEQVFDYVSGFKGYGFAQGHALAFAEISLRSVWLMQHEPAGYFAALLSAQPAGYYGPATIANEARLRGVAVLPLSVNKSGKEFEVESVTEAGLCIPQGGVRVGLMQLAGLSNPTRDRILEYQALAAGRMATRAMAPLPTVHRATGKTMVAVREEEANYSVALRAFSSVYDFARKVNPERDELESLILTGAFDELHPNRRALLWQCREIQDYAKAHAKAGPHPTLDLAMPEPCATREVDDFTTEERAIHERAYLGMDVQHHLLAFERGAIQARGGVTTAEARRLPPGSHAFAVGNPIRLRFPPTASGRRVVFFDLEDETGLLNVTSFDETYRRDGKAIVTSQYVTVWGTVQDRDGSPAFLASRVYPYQPVIRTGNAQRLPLVSADFLVG